MMMELVGTEAGRTKRYSWLDCSGSLRTHRWSQDITLVESDLVERQPVITRFVVAWLTGGQHDGVAPDGGDRGGSMEDDRGSANLS